MKKITLSIIAAFALVCGFAFTNTAIANESATEVTATDSKYERVRGISAYASGYGSRNWYLFKGVNTCDDYYVHDGNQYCAVRKNTNKEMSQYSYVFYAGSGTAWYFNF